MSGSYGSGALAKGMAGVFSVVTFGVWVVKNLEEIKNEFADLQADEIISLVGVAATQELPKLWSAFQASPEENH